MTHVQTSYESAKVRRRRSFAAGIGFLAAAIIMALSLVAFRDRWQVTWPPSSPLLYTAALLLAMAAFSAVVFVLFYVFVCLIAAWSGRESWRDFLGHVMVVVTIVAMVAASATLSLKAFYWPWARANAMRTLLDRNEKWRLVASAETVVDTWSRSVDRSTRNAMLDAPPETRAAVAYTLALRGEKSYLKRMLDAARTLPPSRPDGDPVTAFNDISSQADVIWLLNRLTGAKCDTFDACRAWLDASYDSLAWDGHGRYQER